MHGGYSNQRATLLELSGQDPTTGGVKLRAVIDEIEPPYGHFRVSRTIYAAQGAARIELVDETVNLGSDTEPAPILYHVNLGYPLISEGVEVAISSSAAAPRDETSREQSRFVRRLGPPQSGAPEAVFEHAIVPDAEGWGSATVVNKGDGVQFKLSWDTSSLPRFHQWISRSVGWYVLGLEPANCSVMGRAHDRTEGRLPYLAPGERRVTRLVLDITELQR